MFVPRSDFGLGRKVAISDPKHQRLAVALSGREIQVPIVMYESAAGVRGRTRGRVLASTFGEDGWDLSGYPPGWNPDTDPLTDTDREALIDAYAEEYDFQTNAWLETIDLEEGWELEEVRLGPNGASIENTRRAASGQAIVPDCTDREEDLRSARIGLVATAALAIGVIVGTPVTVVTTAGVVTYTAARVFLGRALAGLIGIGAQGEVAHTKKKQLNRCRNNPQVV